MEKRFQVGRKTVEFLCPWGMGSVNRLVVQLKYFIQPLLQKHVVGKNTARDILHVTGAGS